MTLDVRDYYGEVVEELTERELTWLGWLHSEFNDCEGELDKGTATHLLLLVAAKQLQSLEQLFEAGWQGDDPTSPHRDAIRRLLSEIARVGEKMPATQPERDP